MAWGNFTMDSINKDDSGNITSIDATFIPGDTDFAKTKKMTWVENIKEHLVTVKLLEYDTLITKPALAKGDNFEDFVTTPSEFEVRISFFFIFHLRFLYGVKFLEET